MDIEKSLPYVSKCMQSCDWSKASFSWEKAFISSVFSNLAYCHISDFELKNTNNVNLIPSSAYEKSIRSYIGNNVKSVNNLLQESNVDAESIAVESQLAIAIAVRFGKIVFISLRGTKFLNICYWRCISSHIVRFMEQKIRMG